MSFKEKIENAVFKNQLDLFLKLRNDLILIKDKLKESEAAGRLIVEVAHGFTGSFAGDSIEIYDEERDVDYAIGEEYFNTPSFLTIPLYEILNEEIVAILLEEVGIKEYKYEEYYWDD